MKDETLTIAITAVATEDIRMGDILVVTLEGNQTVARRQTDKDREYLKKVEEGLQAFIPYELSGVIGGIGSEES